MIISKSKKRLEEDYKTCYFADLLGVLASGKNVKGVKPFNELLTRIRSEEKEDERTVEEITEEVLKKFGGGI